MKKLFFVFVSLSFFLFIGCDNEEPVSSNDNNNSNSLTGTWKLNYTGSSNDTLTCSLNINGSNNNLGGSGNAVYSKRINSTNMKAESSGTITGTYSDSNIKASFGNFSFEGVKSGSNYTGTAILIYYFSPTAETLSVQNATFIKQ